MENKVAVYDREMTALDVRKQVNLIQDVMKNVMKENEHYGKISGCGDKVVLLKAGAEKIAMTFRLAAEYEEISGSVESDDFICYKINCKLTYIPTGVFVGSGRGTCNSKEKKYKTRMVYVNKATDEEKAIGKEEERTGKDGKKYKVLIVPQNPWDLQNTLYKMACKRALVAGILTVTAASDIFTQDIEDLPEGTVLEEAPAAPAGKPEVKKPATKAPTRASMLKAFEEEKARIGTVMYADILGTAGYTTPEEIPDLVIGKKIITQMRAIKIEEEAGSEA